MMMMWRLLLASAALACGLLASCGSDVGLEGDFVGGPCERHADCDPGARCLFNSSDYPSGHCSPACDNDDMCPPSTVCVDLADGVCLLFCESGRDCRANYRCKDVNRRGASGQDTVCVGDD